MKMNINLPYVEDASEKLKRILRTHMIRSTFHSENNLHKLLCKTKDQVDPEDKNNIVYETDCSNCEEVCFCEYKRLDQHKRFVKNYNSKKIWNCETLIGRSDKNTDKKIKTLTGIKRKLLLGKAD